VDLIELTEKNLPVSSILTFVIGFVVKAVQADSDLFKNIRLVINEFVKDGSSGKKFHIKCRYLKFDKKIDKKLARIRKSSNLMITEELIYIDSEF